MVLAFINANAASLDNIQLQATFSSRFNSLKHMGKTKRHHRKAISGILGNIR